MAAWMHFFMIEFMVLVNGVQKCTYMWFMYAYTEKTKQYYNYLFDSYLPILGIYFELYV